MKRSYLFFCLPLLFWVFVSCNKEGLQGPQGDTGATGPAGATGLTGPAGADGSVIYSGNGAPSLTIGKNGDYYLDRSTGNLYGPKAANGWGTPLLLAGANGATGPQGATGAAGATGATGPQGATGAAGPQGSTGPAGPQGATGTAGSQIYSGTGSPALTVGTTGDYYLDKTNFLLYGPKTIAAGWGTPVLLRGAQGPQGPAGPAGADGSIIYSGNGSPDAALGKAGDYYFDKTARALYGPKAATGWGVGTSLIGATGATGATGASGPAGATGAVGQTGATGAQGPAGANGNSILNGTGAPSNSIGTTGDFYLDTQTYLIYGPKTASGWGNGTTLKAAANPVTAYESSAIAGWVIPSNVVVGTSAPANFVLGETAGAGPPLQMFQLPDATASIVEHGIILVYLHITNTDPTNDNWIQLSYINVISATNIQSYTFKTITSASSSSVYVQIHCDIANGAGNPASVKLNIDKIRIIAVPNSATGTLSSFSGQSINSVMQQLHLNDNSFNQHIQ